MHISCRWMSLGKLYSSWGDEMSILDKRLITLGKAWHSNSKGRNVNSCHLRHAESNTSFKTSEYTNTASIYPPLSPYWRHILRPQTNTHTLYRDTYINSIYISAINSYTKSHPLNLVWVEENTPVILWPTLMYRPQLPTNPRDTRPIRHTMNHSQTAAETGLWGTQAHCRISIQQLTSTPQPAWSSSVLCLRW